MKVKKIYGVLALSLLFGSGVSSAFEPLKFTWNEPPLTVMRDGVTYDNVIESCDIIETSPAGEEVVLTTIRDPWGTRGVEAGEYKYDGGERKFYMVCRNSSGENGEEAIGGVVVYIDNPKGKPVLPIMFVN